MIAILCVVSVGVVACCGVVSNLSVVGVVDGIACVVVLVCCGGFCLVGVVDNICLVCVVHISAVCKQHQQHKQCH